MSPLGDGGMNLPFEENPERFDTNMDMVVCGGLVVMAAVVPVDGRTEPALIFRFSQPHGEFLPPITLVVTAAEMVGLVDLVTMATASAIKAAKDAA